MRRRAPDLANRVQQIDDDIRVVEAKREDIQGKVRTLAGQVGASRRVIKDLQNALRTLHRNRGKLSAQLSSTATVGAELRILPEAAAIADAIRRFEQQLAELEAERTALDAAPKMLSLLDHVTNELAQAEGEGLGSQIAVDDEGSGAQLTVTQTREGMRTRRIYPGR